MSLPAAPAVSVIIATYNRSPVLRLALESVQRQTFTDWECLVVGDGCTDGSGAIVESLGDPRFHWHNLARHWGSQAGPNRLGLSIARGRWVAYLGHDDLWFPWHLSLLVETIEREGADFAHALMVYFSATGFAGCWGLPPDGVSYAEIQIPPSCWLHRRELADELGGWADPDTISVYVDFHILRRMVLSGAKFAYQPRLSVLKFPTWFFPGAYRNEDVPRQAALLRLMILDSEAVEHGLLEESANRLAQLQRQAEHAHIAQLLQDAEAPDAVERFQELRRGIREQRGLPGSEEWLGTPPAIQAIAPNPLRTQPALDQHSEGAAIDIHCSGATAETYAILDGVPLETCVASSELVTAVVPDALLAHPRATHLALINRGGTSPPVPCVIAGGTVSDPAPSRRAEPDGSAPRARKRRKRKPKR